MKMTTLKSVAIAAGVLGLALPAFGQATSEVVGYYTETFEPGFNVFGVSLHSSPITSGKFESDLTDTDGADFASILNEPNTTYLLEIESGAEAGAVAEVTASSATTLSAGGLVTGAADYTIRKAYTLSDVFGTSLTGSFNASGADVVWLPDGSGGYDQYFYSTTGSQFRSASAPFAVSPPIPIFYPDGMFVQLKGATDKSVTVSGDLKNSPTVLAAENGFNVVSNPGPVGVTLGDMGLQANLTGSFNATAADIVWLPNGAGFDQYFFSTTASVWRSAGSPFAGDATSTVVPSAFFIQRKGSSTSAVANVPDYYAGL